VASKGPETLHGRIEQCKNQADRESGNKQQKIGKGRRMRREEQRGKGGIYEKQQGDRARAFPN